MTKTMRNLILSILSAIAFFSCSKKNGETINIPANVPDTLSAGWVKTGAGLPVETISDVFFTDNANGYATSASGIYRSTNGGVTFSKKSIQSNPINIGAFGIDRACFVSNSDVVITTQDGGNSFQSVQYNAPGGAPAFEDCFFSSANICYLASKRYVWKSINGGVSFDTIYAFPVSTGYNSLFFLNDQVGFVYKSEGIFKTTDGGLSWSLSKSLSSGSGAVQFTDASTGYAVDYENNLVYIFKTTDGGANWQTIRQEPINDLASPRNADIDFVSSTVGYYCAENRIHKTTDGGATWNVVVALGRASIVEIHFINENTGWASVSDGSILKFN